MGTAAGTGAGGVGDAGVAGEEVVFEEGTVGVGCLLIGWHDGDVVMMSTQCVITTQHNALCCAVTMRDHKTNNTLQHTSMITLSTEVSRIGRVKHNHGCHKHPLGDTRNIIGEMHLR